MKTRRATREGFVERLLKPNRLRELLKTAKNGKAIVWPWKSLGNYHAYLIGAGFRGHVQQQPDGTFIAWCERIKAGSPQ